MCELLGINSQHRFDTTPLLADFFERGGQTADHADGWGLASFDRFDDLQITKHESAAAACPHARTVLHSGNFLIVLWLISVRPLLVIV